MRGGRRRCPPLGARVVTASRALQDNHRAVVHDLRPHRHIGMQTPAIPGPQSTRRFEQSPRLRATVRRAGMIQPMCSARTRGPTLDRRHIVTDLDEPGTERPLWRDGISIELTHLAIRCRTSSGSHNRYKSRPRHPRHRSRLMRGPTRCGSHGWGTIRSVVTTLTPFAIRGPHKHIVHIERVLQRCVKIAPAALVRGRTDTVSTSDRF